MFLKFSFIVILFSGCNEHLLAKDMTDMTEVDEYVTPAFPRYGNNLFCSIEITSTDTDKCVQIEFITFDVEASSGCV